MEQVQEYSISNLKVHPRNNEFFDDISGEAYEQFKNSIINEGILTPLIISPDLTVISGHQRLKAAKEIGLSMIPVIIIQIPIEEIFDFFSYCSLNEIEKMMDVYADIFSRRKINIPKMPINEKKRLVLNVVAWMWVIDYKKNLIPEFNQLVRRFIIQLIEVFEKTTIKNIRILSEGKIDDNESSFDKIKKSIIYDFSKDFIKYYYIIK